MTFNLVHVELSVPVDSSVEEETSCLLDPCGRQGLVLTYRNTDARYQKLTVRSVCRKNPVTVEGRIKRVSARVRAAIVYTVLQFAARSDR